LNGYRQYGWPVFRMLVELDCRANRTPDAVEISLGELAERLGMDWEKVGKIIEVLQKKKVLAAFLPDNPDEPGLFQVRTPLAVPKSAEEVAREARDPSLRDPTAYRYAKAEEDRDGIDRKTQHVIDLYLNKLSQKLNSFIVDEIEILAQRFPLEAIERTIDRAAKHEIRSIGWVARELIRDASKNPKNRTKNP
jgi:DNA-binding MarR family transcriptional regulator